MKKLVLMFAAIAAISFASCGNNAKNEAATDTTTVAADSDTTTQDSVPADSVPADSVK